MFSFPALFSFGQKTEKSSATARPFILGVIEELHSKELGEKRTLNIYLPEGYSPENTTQYPVIYLLDGAADEDFIHIAGLVQFNNFEWVNQVPKSIVVGIASVNRPGDFTFPTTDPAQSKRYPASGHSDKFIAFIEKELQPFIASRYKGSNHSTLIGQSLGGLLAAEILVKKPELFNKYIIVSPSLWWDNGSLLQQKVAAFENTNIYIGVGKEGLTPTEIPRVMEVDANLLTEKIKSLKSKGVTVHFDYLPQENHATILHQAVANAFRYFHTITSKE